MKQSVTLKIIHIQVTGTRHTSQRMGQNCRGVIFTIIVAYHTPAHVSYLNLVKELKQDKVEVTLVREDTGL